VSILLKREEKVKVKLDFVTNSSSTSFCAWGIEVELDKLPDKFKKFLYNKLKKENQSYDDFCDMLDDCLYDLLYVSDLGLECTISAEDNLLYLGLHPTRMPEDVTLREFKESIIKKLHEIGFDNVENLEFIDEEIW
jgi:hypothetical protein